METSITHPEDGTVKTKMFRFSVAIGWFCCAGSLWAGPLEDLSSSSQETRDAAAKILREGDQKALSKEWEALKGAIREGDTRKEVMDFLQPREGTFELKMRSGEPDTDADWFRLDDHWVLWCTFRKKGDILLRLDLVKQPSDVPVSPPAGFTGLWTTYYVNGQRSQEAQYVDGKRSGTSTSFRADGTILSVQNWAEGLLDGEMLGFSPVGKVRDRYHFRAGKPAGTWTTYHEDGTVKSTHEHPEK
jgi:hypothetical protein